MKVRAWSPLKKGDIVDVVAPGFGTPAETVETARKFLLRWGLVPRIPPGLIAPHFLHANEDRERFRFLKAALAAPDSAAVWCLRGGYGSNRLLPFLAKMKRPRRNKLFIGISDITSLHVFLNQEWNWATVHGPLLDRLGLGKVSPAHEREMKKLVFGESASIEFTKLRPMNEAARAVKTLRAPIVGGNLITLQGNFGTSWAVNARGKFLFLEDLGERGYRIDRVLEHLKQSGLERGCRGVLLGDFIGGREEDGSTTIPAVFARWARESKIPIFSGVPAGHAPVQRPVPFGPVATLRASGRGFQISIPTGAAR